MSDEPDPSPPRDPAQDPPASPPSHTALHTIAWFLDWCREHGYRAGPLIEYGGARMQVADLRQATREGMRAEPEKTIWEEYEDKRG